MNEILIPVAILSGLGLVFGVLLGIAAKIFAVKKDERIDDLESRLYTESQNGKRLFRKNLELSYKSGELDIDE